MNFLKKSLFTTILLSQILQSQELLKTQTSWDGGSIAYPKGKAEITSIKLKIDEGVTSKFHCHPVPTLGYILKGSVEIETIDGKKVVLKEGDSAVEVMGTIHRGKAVDSSVEILVFYAGSVDTPTTVLAENDPDYKHCKKALNN